MLGQLIEQIRQDYSHAAMIEEWNRRQLAQDFSFAGLDRGKAMMQKAFEILIQEKKDKP